MTSVRKDVPPYVRVAREPLSYAGVNSIGLRRRGMADQTVKTIEDIYRLLFVLNNSISKGVTQIINEIDDCAEKSVVIDFINKSDKGIIKGLI
jgi:UDP-N-acetylglucosamine acyltransferase